MIRLEDITGGTSKKRLKAGKYTAEVKYCDFDPEFINNSAIKVIYALTDAAGIEYEFAETYYYRLKPARTVEFMKHLASLGIDKNNLPDYVGVREEFELKKNATTRGTMLTIDNSTRQVLD